MTALPDRPITSRKQPRVQVDFAAAKMIHEKETVYAELDNISLGGMAIMCDRSFPFDSEVSCIFALADGASSTGMIRVTCRVKHTTRNNEKKVFITGLHFIDPQPEHLDIIRHYVNARDPLAQLG